MLRYLSPTLFFAAAIYAYWHNTSGGGSIWVLPFMDVIWPETANSPTAQGEKSVIVLIVLGCVITVWRLFEDRRHRKRLGSNLETPQS